MNNITITETSVYDRRRRWLRMAAITAVAVTLVLLLPVTAHAEEPEYHWITDFGGSLRKFICSMILGWATSIFNVYNQLINHVGTEALLSGPFDSLLGTDMYNLTNNIFQTAVIPVGESILALFMLVQLVKISQRIDATSTLPAVKEIVFLAVIYVLLHWFINNSLDIMQAIYGIVNDDIIPTIGSVGDSTGEAGVFSLDGVTQDQWGLNEHRRLLHDPYHVRHLPAFRSCGLRARLRHVLRPRMANLHLRRVLPDPHFTPRFRGNPTDGHRVPEELRVRLSGRGDPAVPVRGLPIRARGIGVKPQRGQ